ncbi:MAG TPA: PQQ-dependent sugar dehydrogenase [Acidimicrobiia bacterium]|nr:PQQ-dependent sugar dehydrogenase [Acidimicrobiia bacterium]
MTARHRQPSTPDHGRYRALLIALVAVFLVAFLILRVFGSGGGSGEPSAGGDTTTSTDGSADSTTPDDGSSTTTPGDGASSSTTSSADPDLAPLQSVSLDLILDGFQQPTVVTAPSGDDRLFVAERFGAIRVIDATGVKLDAPFLDMTESVSSNGIERGLLGLAFHPDYANNGRFFIYYTDKDGRRQLSEFAVSPTDPNIAFAAGEKVIFEYEQPPNSTDIRHYAGNVAFGPDGFLWVSMGDGADSRAQGQDPNTPYGTIVRIDVDSGDPYSIPPDNPFVDGGGLGDVWAYGLRNPWRFSIDPVDRLIYIADVGHADQEEVNVVSIDEGGYNFGWSNMEGTRCFHEQDCDPANYTSPVLTYLHAAPDDDPDAVIGLSITGGYVYRGSEIPEIAGTYFYSDWVSSWVRGFKFVDGQVTEDRDWTEDLGGEVGQVMTYGLDGHGELYLATYEGGIYKFTAVR